MTAKHLEKALVMIRLCSCCSSRSIGKYGSKDQISKAVETLGQIATQSKRMLPPCWQ